MGLFGSKPAEPIGNGMQAPPTSSGSWLRTLFYVLGAAILLYFGYVTYNYIARRNGLTELSVPGASVSTGDQAPAPLDGKARTVIPGGSNFGGTGDYGLQFWMFVSDWDYRFGQPKSILKRVNAANASSVNPEISLHPTDNTLDVTVALYPSGQSGNDTFTCSVENIPLQAWFSVSATVFQRNLDVYINGRLVKSCALPGVPKPAAGDLVVGDNGGFSGSVCNVYGYPTMLSPEDAKAFFAAGTSCQAPAMPASKAPGNSVGVTLFGYAFKFSTIDKMGKELSSFVF